MAAVVLWHIELSHYNEKARWALDYKAIPHERRTPLPGMHRPAAMVLTRSSHDRLPILGLDGRRIGDSTAIIEALEAYRPDPPLYPADPEQRQRALALEDYFDEELGPRLRRLYWHHTLGDADATIDALFPADAKVRRRIARVLTPVIRPVARRDYDVSEATAAEAVDGVRVAMDRLEAELQPSGHLVGEEFSVADLAAASMFTPVLAPPGRQYAPAHISPELAEIRAELSAREGGAWIVETFARYRGSSAEIAG